MLFRSQFHRVSPFSRLIPFFYTIELVILQSILKLLFIPNRTSIEIVILDPQSILNTVHKPSFEIENQKEGNWNPSACPPNCRRIRSSWSTSIFLITRLLLFPDSGDDYCTFFVIVARIPLLLFSGVMFGRVFCIGYKTLKCDGFFSPPGCSGCALYWI